MVKFTESDIESCVERFNAALINRDAEVLRELTDDALSYGHSKGKIEDREGFINNVLSDSATQFASIQISDQTVALTQSIAIVRHALNAVTRKNGVSGELRANNLMVWRCADEQWKLIARQAFTV